MSRAAQPAQTEGLLLENRIFLGSVASAIADRGVLTHDFARDVSDPHDATF